MMKRVLGVACALLLTASVANAGALADNDQAQGQFDGGFAVSGAPGAAFVAGGAGFQGGSGYSLATPGDYAYENQSQIQGTYEFQSADDGNGNFAGVETGTLQEQTSGSQSFGGAAGNIQGQAIVVGAGGLTTGGTFGVAGSAGAAIGGSASGAIGFADTANNQSQVGFSNYEQQSVGPNSFVYQTGSQEFGTRQGSGAALIGVAGGASGVYQAGGTVALNDGNAGFMDGSGTAAGDAWAVSGSAGIAGASADAFGVQEHSYAQGAVSADGTNFQGQVGTVGTAVQASSQSGL